MASSNNGNKNNPPSPGTVALMKRYRTEVAASAGSIFSTAICFPLDSVKTRMQTYEYKGVLDCFRRTYREERIPGFFRGVTAPLVSITLVRTVSFSLYQKCKHVVADRMKDATGVDVLGHVHKKGTYPNLSTVTCFGLAGAATGAVITTVACPFELTKLSAQLSTLLADPKNHESPKCHAVAASYKDKGTLRTMQNIVKHRGFCGLYTGFGLHAFRDTVGTCLYFMVYESGKQLGKTLAGDNPYTSKLVLIGAGGLCGIVSWALIYPIDSAKSIYQKNSLLYTKGETVAPAPKIEWFKRHMYRGLGVSMVRSCLVNAFFFPTFEFLKKRILTWPDDRD